MCVWFDPARYNVKETLVLNWYYLIIMKLKDDFNQSGYNQEELYFAKVNYELMEKLRKKKMEEAREHTTEITMPEPAKKAA